MESRIGFLESLPTRTLASLLTLHITVNPGNFHCLDVNIHRASLAELHTAVLAHLATLELDDVLPAAPEAQWRDTFTMRLIRRYVLNYLTHSGSYLGVVTLEER